MKESPAAHCRSPRLFALAASCHPSQKRDRQKLKNVDTVLRSGLHFTDTGNYRGFVLKAILSDSQFLVPAVVFVGGIILLAILR